MFFNKRKLLAKTNVKDLADMFPVVAAKDCLPSWYRAMKLTYTIGNCPVPHSIANKAPTIKGCDGIHKLLMRGFVIPAWQDMSIFVYPDKRVSFEAALKNRNTFDVHDVRQLPPHWQDRVTIKLNSPWFLFGDATEYLMVPMPFHSDLSIDNFMPSGIVNFRDQHSTNLFFSVKPKQEAYEIFIKAGQPLVQFIPLSADKIRLDVEYDRTFMSDSPTRFFLLHAYRRYMNTMRGKTK